jgi:hypothetical protein
MRKKILSNDEIYAIINQTEVFVSTNAADLADAIAEKRIRAEQRAYDSLKQKVVDATVRMVADMNDGSDIELSDDDMLALSKVTDGLRDLGYKFRFIEVQDQSGEILKNKLFISVKHLV